MRSIVSLQAVSALGFVPCLVAFLQINDERTRYSIVISAVISILGFFATKLIVPLVKARTLKAGLGGKDINKKGSKAGEKDIPESLGLAPGLVFLVNALLFIARADFYLHFGYVVSMQGISKFDLLVLDEELVLCVLFLHRFACLCSSGFLGTMSRALLAT